MSIHKHIYEIRDTLSLRLRLSETQRSAVAVKPHDPAKRTEMLLKFAKLLWLLWLPVAERVQYKLCLLVHKSLLGHTPEYISDFLTSAANIAGRSTLRASSCGNLVVPRTCRRIGDRAFFCCCTASMEQAIDGAKTAAIDGLVSS